MYGLKPEEKRHVFMREIADVALYRARKAERAMAQRAIKNRHKFAPINGQTLFCKYT